MICNRLKRVNVSGPPVLPVLGGEVSHGSAPGCLINTLGFFARKCLEGVKGAEGQGWGQLWAAQQWRLQVTALREAHTAANTMGLPPGLP